MVQDQLGEVFDSLMTYLLRWEVGSVQWVIRFSLNNFFGKAQVMTKNEVFLCRGQKVQSQVLVSTLLV